MGRARHFLYLFLIVPATPISLYLVVRSIAALSVGESEKSEKSERPVVHALALLPNIVVAIRGIFVLLFLSIGHVDLLCLIRSLESVVYGAIPKEKLLQFIKRWTVINTVAVVYCVGSFVPVCVLNGFHSAELMSKATNGSVVLMPFAAEIPVWAYIGVEAVFAWLPYVLSQLVLLCIVTSCLVVYDCFAALNKSLRCLEAKMPGVVSKEKQLEAELSWTGIFKPNSVETEFL